MPIEGLPGGDFAGCVAKMRGTMDSPEAFCAWKIHELTGKWPSEEALALARPAEVREARESMRLAVTEAALADDGALSGVVLVEGESANGTNVYTAEALRSIPEVFSEAPIYLNHSTEGERRERPEGDVRQLVGRLPGADGFTFEERDGRLACLFSGGTITSEPPFVRDRIRRRIWRDMSINALGEGAAGADGRFYVTRFIRHPHTSLDIVSVGAAGGEVFLSEAEVQTMARDIVGEALKTAKVPVELQPALRRIVEACAVQQEGEMVAIVAPEKPEKPQMAQEQMELPAEVAGLPAELAQAWAQAYEMAVGEGAEELAAVHAAWLSVVAALLPAEPEIEEEAQTEALARVAALAAKEALAHASGRVSGMGRVAALPAADVDADLREALAGWGAKNPDGLIKRLRGGL